MFFWLFFNFSLFNSDLKAKLKSREKTISLFPTNSKDSTRYCFKNVRLEKMYASLLYNQNPFIIFFHKSTAATLKVKYLFPLSHWDHFTPMSRNIALTSSSMLFLDYAHFMLIWVCVTYSEVVEDNYIFEMHLCCWNNPLLFLSLMK